MYFFADQSSVDKNSIEIIVSLAGVTEPTQKLHLRNARLWLRDGCAKKIPGFSCCAIKSCYLEETRGFSVARSNEAAPNGPKCNYS